MITILNRMLDRPDLGKFILRLAFAGMMLPHGIHKMMHGIDNIIGMVVHHGMPAFVGYGVYIGEVLMPILLILGILVRPAALIFCFTMIFAWLITNPAAIFTFDKVGGWGVEIMAVYFFAGLAMAFLGCGRISIMKNPGWR
ncbi:DoxX family protein [Martelella alba]|uniref:DoxX family protein n=1 Tax=Martelella alba TaxID=2590451 RepID=A0ABY2SP68_9HYPH|nr:DoxX family protein [Martelella alba]TKI07191.1 DoxX family protein [Martelella alba]